MKRQKTIVVLTATVMALLIAFSGSTQGFLSAENAPDIKMEGLENFGEPIAESDGLLLYVDSEAATFAVKNTKDGSLYCATPLDWEDDEIASGRFYTELSAVMIFTYLNGATKTEQEANCVIESVNMGGFKAFKIKNGVVFNFDFPQIGITIPIYIRLEKGALIVDVPIEKIKESADNKVLKISLCPYFGAGGQNDSGYLFIPDGSGALIDFNNGKTWAGQYNGSVYGSNIDIISSQKKFNLETIHLAAFGIKRNDTAFVAAIDSGAAQASIYAFPSGVRSGYNSAYTQFEIREAAVYKLDEGWQGTKTFMHFQETKPNLSSARIKYFFLKKDSGYTEMALKYREYLLSKKAMKKSKDSQIPLLSVIGALNTEKNIIGISYTERKALTSVEELGEIAKEIGKEINSPFNVRYFNWSEQSASGKLQDKVKISKALGNKNELNSVAATLKKQDIGLYLDVSPWTYKQTSKLFQDFVYATKAVTGVKVAIPFYKLSTGAPDYSVAQTKVVVPQKLDRVVSSLTKSLNRYDVMGVSVSGLDGLNYSHFGKDVSERAQTQATIKKSLKMIRDTSGKMMLNNPSQEQLANANMIFNISNSTTKMNVFDRTIPFYQLVISGIIPYTESEINLNENSRYGLLYCLRSGSAPHYIVGANMDSDPLQNTEYEHIVSSKYDDWKEQIVKVFNEYAKTVEEIGSTRIVDYKHLADEVTETVYESGVSVVVNTSDKTYLHNGQTVNSGSYLVYGG